MRLTKSSYVAPFLLLFAAASCSKKESEIIDQTERISICASVQTTKSLLTSTDLIGQTQIKVFDILSDGEYTKHIEGDTGSYVDADSPWRLSGEPVAGYSWRPDHKICNHNFFTWISRDKDGLTPTSIFGSDLTLAPNSPDNGIYTVNIPQTGITLGSNQFDFCYSDIATRDVATSNYSMVNLSLKHFFTSFGIKAHNYDSDPITITSIKLYGIKNRKSATITYDTTTPSSAATVAYSTPSSDWRTSGSGLELLGGNITIDPDEEVNNIITCAAGGSKSKNAEDAFYLMWPQTEAELASNYDGEGNLIVDYSHAILGVTYSAGSGASVTRYVSLCPLGKSQGWDAGTCHKIELSFTSKFIELSVSVLPWEFIERDVNYDKQISCNSEGELKFVGGTYYKDPDDPSNTIYFKNAATPIRGYFSFATPVNGSWMISKNGDFDAFEIDNEEFGTFGDGVDYAYGTIDGNSVAYFTIYPKDQDPKRDYSIKLAFAVRTTSGDVYAADDVIQGQDPTKYYTIVLQSMN